MKINLLEVGVLTLIFSALAIYTDIFRDNHVWSFITGHVIALALALVIARVIFHVRK